MIFCHSLLSAHLANPRGITRWISDSYWPIRNGMRSTNVVSACCRVVGYVSGRIYSTGRTFWRSKFANMMWSLIVLLFRSFQDRGKFIHQLISMTPVLIIAISLLGTILMASLLALLLLICTKRRCRKAQLAQAQYKYVKCWMFTFTVESVFSNFMEYFYE